MSCISYSPRHTLHGRFGRLDGRTLLRVPAEAARCVASRAEGRRVVADGRPPVVFKVGRPASFAQVFVLVKLVVEELDAAGKVKRRRHGSGGRDAVVRGRGRDGARRRLDSRGREGRRGSRYKGSHRAWSRDGKGIQRQDDERGRER